MDLAFRGSVGRPGDSIRDVEVRLLRMTRTAVATLAAVGMPLRFFGSWWGWAWMRPE